jgi:hypothetical protein
MPNLITVEKIVKHDPCWKLDDGSYDRDAIRAVVGDGITLLYLLRKAGKQGCRLTHEDAVWVATRKGFLNPTIQKQWIEIIVSRAVREHALHCGVKGVEAWAEKWLSGEDRTADAAQAAREAAWVTAWAAEAAARAAQEAGAAQAAAWAAWAAREAGAAEAARVEERKQQVKDLIGLLERAK